MLSLRRCQQCTDAGTGDGRTVARGPTAARDAVRDAAPRNRRHPFAVRWSCDEKPRGDRTGIGKYHRRTLRRSQRAWPQGICPRIPRLRRSWTFRARARALEHEYLQNSGCAGQGAVVVAIRQGKSTRIGSRRERVVRHVSRRRRAGDIRRPSRPRHGRRRAVLASCGTGIVAGAHLEVPRLGESSLKKHHTAPHTSRAVSITNRSFAVCDSTAMSLPCTVLENPHCGDRQSCSSGMRRAASSILRLSASLLSSSPSLVVTRPSTTVLPLGTKRKGAKSPERASSYSRK